MVEQTELSKIDGLLTRAGLIDTMKGDGGPIDTLLGYILSYLQENFAGFSLSDGNQTSVKFVLYFTYDKFDTLPMVAIDVVSSDMQPMFIGAVSHVDDTNTPLRTMAGKVYVIFDVIARNSREKDAIVGFLSNVLYRGLYDGTLREKGILNVEFIRSVNRGMEQSDKVLYLHSHQLISDTIFRHLVEYRFDFLTPITYPTQDTDYYFLHSVEYNDSYSSRVFSENSAFLELKFYYDDT